MQRIIQHPTSITIIDYGREKHAHDSRLALTPMDEGLEVAVSLGTALTVRTELSRESVVTLHQWLGEWLAMP